VHVNDAKASIQLILMELHFVLSGWFEVVQQDWKPNHSCHSNVGDVAKTKCKQFLVRTTIICHLSADNNNDGEFQVGPETRIHPGEILNVVDVITKKWKTKSVGDVTDKKVKKELSTKFLQCIDNQERRVFLSFAHPGEFYPLWDSEHKSKTPKHDYAYYIHDLLGYGFPLRVRVVFGWPPADFPHFSGFLRLLGVSRPDTLVLRSLKPNNCVVTELPIDCDVKIERTAADKVSGNKSFDKLLAHSCDRIYPYLIGMKHMDTCYPVLPPTETENTNGKSPDPVNSESSNNKDNKTMCRMARPRDMKHFDTMDIFPPLQEPIRQMADSWTLSFKDPEYASGDSDLRDAESIIVDPESATTLKNGALDSELKGIKINEPPMPRREQMLQRGAQMEQILAEREADC
jgi:hypothetical protein